MATPKWIGRLLGIGMLWRWFVGANSGARESIWSVTQRTRDIYFAAFAILFLGGVALEAYWAWSTGLDTLASARAVWQSAAPIAITLAAAALLLTEVVRILMGLARRLEENVEHVREQRREEGLSEERAKWNEWLRRKEQAEAHGEEFTEPPPS